jgi:hypothetical protein
MKRYETGATLIVVLVFLVALTIIGTLAIRQSVVGLGIATNSQAQQLQAQNSDASFFKAEDRERLSEALSGIGMFGYTSKPVDREKELVFCYRGDQREFFKMSLASIVDWESGSAPRNNVKGKSGYCDATVQPTNFFTSARRAVMTQVSIKFLAQPTGVGQTLFGDRVAGSDDKQVQLDKAKRIKVFAVSVMPTLSKVSRTDINVCLQERMNEVTIPEGEKIEDNNPVRQTVSACLANLGVPFSTYVTEYLLVDFVK